MLWLWVFCMYSRLTDRDVCTSCITLHLTKSSVKDHHSLESIFYSAPWFLYEPWGPVVCVEVIHNVQVIGDSHYDAIEHVKYVDDNNYRGRLI